MGLPDTVHVYSWPFKLLLPESWYASCVHTRPHEMNQE